MLTPLVLSLGLFSICLLTLVNRVQYTPDGKHIRTVDYPEYHLQTEYVHPHAATRQPEQWAVGGTDYVNEDWDTGFGTTGPYKDFGEKPVGWDVKKENGLFKEMDYDDFFMIRDTMVGAS